MCGIAGVFDVSGRRVDRLEARLRRMNACSGTAARTAKVYGRAPRHVRDWATCGSASSTWKAAPSRWSMSMPG